MVADVDRPGVRIAVGVGSAYDLYLTRNLKNATLVRAKTGGGRAMIDLFLSEKLEAAAGVKQPLVEYAKTDPNVRVMDGRFQVIEQAMGMPKGRPAAARYLRAFVEEMKASGFVADALKRSNQPDAEVAPPGRDLSQLPSPRLRGEGDTALQKTKPRRGEGASQALRPAEAPPTPTLSAEVGFIRLRPLCS